MSKSPRDICIETHQAGNHAEAMRLYGRYLGAVPNDAQMWSNYGALLRTTKNYRNAERAHERAFGLAPNSRVVRANYANILSDLGKYQQSLDLRLSLVRDRGDDPEQHALIGRCYRCMGNYQAAVSYLKPHIAAYPKYPDLRLQAAMALLAMGAYDEAFELYRARWQTDELTHRKLAFPEWAGQALSGKHIIVLPEQGFGDCVLMSRHLPDLKELGATVSVLAEKPLFRLMQSIEGADHVVSQIQSDAGYDYWINMMDLGGINLQTDADIRPPARLSVPDSSRERARGMVAPYTDTFKVGVVWTGSVTYRANAFRSFSHNDFLPLTDIPNVQLFSLYKGPLLDKFYDDGAAGMIVDAGSTDQDFADCAAMMQEMDLIITSDTATAHIAGSLGLPVWTVLHMDAFWVYRHTGDTTPWYPSMRLFRQKNALDWKGVMAQVANELKQRVADHG